MEVNSHPHVHEQIICANVFIRKDGKYLLLRRSPLKKYAPDFVHPYGGKVEPNENPYLAAVREIYEETGLYIKNMRLEAVLTEITPIAGEPFDWLIFHFSADYASGELQPTNEGEAVMLTAEQLKEEKLFPSVAAIIEHVTNSETGTVFGTFEYDSDKTYAARQTLDFCVI